MSNVVPFRKESSSVLAAKKSKNKEIEKELKGKKDENPALEKELKQISSKYSKFKKQLKLKPELADVKTLKYLLNTTRDLIPLAQADYVKSRRGMYSFIALQNMVRELMQDIRQLSNGDKTANHVISNIFVPNIQLILQHIMNDFNDIKTKYSEKMPNTKSKNFKKEMDDRLKNHGLLLNEITNEVSKQIVKYFVS